LDHNRFSDTSPFSKFVAQREVDLHIFVIGRKNLEKKERMLRRKLEKSKKGFAKVQDGFWKVLEKGWQKVGKRLGRAWEELGEVWEKLGSAQPFAIELDEPENMF
jgi:hypothetical protein